MNIIRSRKEGEGATMLIQFNFKNYKSFREEATLDLSATKMTEFAERVVSIGSEKILPIAAIYGANASGKSNVYNAFEYMSDYVVDSFKYGDEEEKFEEFKPTPFLFDTISADAESSPRQKLPENIVQYFTVEIQRGSLICLVFLKVAGIIFGWLWRSRCLSFLWEQSLRLVSARQSEIGLGQMNLQILVIHLQTSFYHVDYQRVL